MICRNCGNTISDTAKFCHKCGCPVVATPPSPSFDPSRNTVTPEPVPEPVPEKKSFNLLKILLPILGLSVLLVVAVIVLPIGTMFGSGSADSDGDGGYTGDGTVISSEVGTIVHPSEEHIVTDDETLIQYVDNTVLAFIHSDLTDEEKQDVAATVNGTIIGELYECVTMLQIEVEVSTLSELEELIEVLEEHELVYSAFYDFVMEVSTDDTSDVEKAITEHLSDDGWKDIIQLSDAWDKFSDYFTDEAIYIGVVDDNLLPSYSKLSGRVSFGMEYTELRNDTTDASHGTTVCSIIAGKGGVVYSDNVTCYFDSWCHESGTIDTFTEVAAGIATQASMGCKVINNSYGKKYYSEEYYNKNVDKSAYPTYAIFKLAMSDAASKSSLAIAIISCELIVNCGDILFVQSAGNGIDNLGNVGVDAAVYQGLWAGIADSDWRGAVWNLYGLTYQELKDHILIVTAVNDNLSYTGFGFGSTVDIAAPNTWTSFAAPEVTGVATLVWAADSDLTAAEVKQILTNSYTLLGWSDEYSGKVPVVNAYQAVYETLYANYSVTALDEAGSPVSGITLQAWDAEGEILAEETTEDDGVAILVANRMEIDCVVVLDSDGEVLETIVVPEEAKTYDYYSTDMCYAYDIEEFMPHDLGTVEVENEVILLNKLSELIDLYGMVDAAQTGTMTTWYDEWLECAGLVSASILDFDSDDLVEMLVCTAQVVEDRYSVIVMDMWEVEAGTAVLATSIEYTPYFSYRRDSRYTISSASSDAYALTVTAVQTGEDCYLFCEMDDRWYVFADGSGFEYWMLQYKDGTFRYIASLTTWGWGSGEFYYYGVTFNQGKYVSDVLYYATWVEDVSPLYTSFAEAATAYFGQYGVQTRSDASVETSASILSSDNDSVLIFRCVNEVTYAKYDPDGTSKAEFAFTLTRGNTLLQRVTSSED